MPFRHLSQIQELHQLFLDKLADSIWSSEPRGLYEPIEYILSIGGKRVRPLLALMAARMFGDAEDCRAGLPVALAVEVFHNFTLLHDDVMDESPLRRGQPTVHEKWDVNTAILSGDLMLIKAYDLLSRLPDRSRLPELLDTFNRVATGVCEGQQYDVDFERRSDVTIEEYLKMIELKTAVLLGGALEMGALAAGASRADADHLYAFGRLTGLAFQVHDDLLDTFGDGAQTGKLTGNDIIRNKKTFLYIKAVEDLEAGEREELIHWFSHSPKDPAPKVARVTELMRLRRIPELVGEMRDTFQSEAYAHLDAVSGDPAWKAVLREVADSLLRRES
ncbi:geranylgeranyl diphosphate synthase type II [Lewinella marina]|uniref:Polyprenyl synthetase n=1 Tax=Neolewinella marina TaxID=438751 RepID=A0A2G0CJ08_9BACT|nr:polyprenyl synthetase family protein [Neolewinella marina]NJB84875.1 geranylgeranyl diphosphate synthase type II [Neolewinella marina]PHK99971.1 polyprenyl synthetase [Neolewinella marina]